MSGDFATILLGAQEGREASFVRLYELTNPALVRYLRVVSDADPANLALTTWTTLLRRLPTVEADENAWFELVVGVARLTVEDARQRETWSHFVDPAAGLPFTALADLEAAEAATPPAGAGPIPVATDAGDSSPPGQAPPPEAATPGEVGDGVDRTIAALRSCPADEADLLAMRATAWLNRDAICRLTGRDQTSVRVAMDQALEHLGLPLFTLVKALRAPARPEELADLPVALRLFTGGPAQRRVAAAAVAAASVAAAGAMATPSAVRIVDTPVAGTAFRAARHSSRGAAGTAGHAGWVGTTAAAAALAIGGAGVAVWNGLLPDPFGGHGTNRTPSAAGPPRPSPPSGGGLDQQGNPGTAQKPATHHPHTPTELAVGGTTTSATPGSVSLGRVQLAVQVVRVAGPVGGVSGTPVTGGAVPPPKTPGAVTTPPSTHKPPPSGSPPPTKPVANGHHPSTHPSTHPGKAKGHTKAKAQGKAKGHTKTQTPAQTQPQSHAPAKAQSHAPAKTQPHDKGKALGHDKGKAQGQAKGHTKTHA